MILTEPALSGRNLFVTLYAMVAAVALATLFGAESFVGLAVGVMSLLIAARVQAVGGAAEAAQRREDDGAIANARFVAGQCELALWLMLDPAGSRGQARRALGQLGPGAGTLVTMYGRYLTPETMRAVREVVGAVMEAQVRGEPGAAEVAVAVAKRVRGIRAGIRGVDDPDLRAARRRA